jgi:hypothetical protein
MKDEIKAAEQDALKIIEDSTWDPAKKLMMNKIITTAAWSTNGSEDKLQDITETTFNLAYMHITRDKQIDEIKEIVSGTASDVKSLIDRMDKNDKVTEELKQSFDSVKKIKKGKFQILMETIVALQWKGVIWVTVPLLAILAIVYKPELVEFFRLIF